MHSSQMNDPDALLVCYYALLATSCSMLMYKKDKRSPFGLFCRRAFLTYRKMSFLALCTFAEDFQAWAKGDLSRGYKKIDLRNIRHGEDCSYSLFKLVIALQMIFS